MTHGSLHPIARSLLEALGTRGQKLLAENEMVETRGVSRARSFAEIRTAAWSLGRAGWSGDGPAADAAETAGSELRKNGEPVAAFHFSESLRPGAVAMLRQLERDGLSLHLSVGRPPAEGGGKWPQALGLPENQAHGGLSPEEKAAAVKKMDRQDTLYLGDGANDSLAFDAAFVTGTPVVDRSLLESKADFYTLGSGLEFLPRLLNTAAARENAVRAAFGFALDLQPDHRRIFGGWKNEPAAGRRADADEFDRIHRHRGESFPGQRALNKD